MSKTINITELFAGLEIEGPDLTLEISGITCDSRNVSGGYLFIARKENSLDFIESALSNGAIAILIQDQYKDRVNCKNLYYHKNPSKLYSILLSRFFPKQPDYIVAVTGTNGKTSVTSFCRQIWKLMNKKFGSIGTEGVFTKNSQIKNENQLTTPDASHIHQLLYQFANEQITHVCIEASSHGLDQYRLHSVKLQSAGFTNLSQDHMDYHTTMQNYFNSKKKLFSEILRPHSCAVLNKDSKWYEYLSLYQRKSITYSANESADIMLLKQIPTKHGQILELDVLGQKISGEVSILGKFQAHNLMCAIGLVLSTDVEINNEILSILPPPGRMELIKGINISVVIDYAHTPDALEQALLSLRWHKFTNIVLVFGCGGERDKDKRFIMGQTAKKYADYVIVSDDNPRSEPANIIRKQIMSGVENAIEIEDRTQAIIEGIKKTRPGGVLLIAGKGDEQLQLRYAENGNIKKFNDKITVINHLQ